MLLNTLSFFTSDFLSVFHLWCVAGVRGYPSVRAYFPKQDIDGEVYDGEHTPEAIQGWVNTLRAPPATVKLGRNNFRSRVLEPSAGLWVRKVCLFASHIATILSNCLSFFYVGTSANNLERCGLR